MVLSGIPISSLYSSNIQSQPLKLPTMDFTVLESDHLPFKFPLKWKDPKWKLRDLVPRILLVANLGAGDAEIRIYDVKVVANLA
ncbi:hypothetical protein SOVF_162120 [Spinacia oleracea]|nr:hypothetical protein SOVF_162120 [Spinacia oleracea]